MSLSYYGQSCDGECWTGWFQKVMESGHCQKQSKMVQSEGVVEQLLHIQWNH